MAREVSTGGLTGFQVYDHVINPEIVGNNTVVRRSSLDPFPDGTYQLTTDMSGLNMVFLLDTTDMLVVRLPQVPVIGSTYHIWVIGDGRFSPVITDGFYIQGHPDSLMPIWGGNLDVVPASLSSFLLCGNDGCMVSLMCTGQSWAIQDIRGPWRNFNTG
jgi:hypothetical protein